MGHRRRPRLRPHRSGGDGSRDGSGGGFARRSRPGRALSAGDLWYFVESSQAGYFTVDASYDPSGGDANLRLFSGDGQLVDGSADGGGDERVGHQPTASSGPP